MKNVLLSVFAILLMGTAVVVLGLRATPAPFPAYPVQTPALETVPALGGLPAPVARYYAAAFGERVPTIHSAVISGRGTVRFQGITFPARARFTHDAGRSYRHYIETTVWGRPVLAVNEVYIEGHSRFELPFGVQENEPKLDSAANLGLWAETLMLPAVYATDGRVRWEPINDSTARLVVPFGGAEQSFTATFDLETGLLRRLETMRWADPADPAERMWRAEVLDWQRVNGMLIPATTTATWLDAGTPWLVLDIEEVVYNVDVTEYLRATGP